MPNKISEAEKPSAANRLREELFKYAVVSGYLFICFSMLLLYESTVRGEGQEVLPFSLAVVKALVLGKFLLIGEAMKAGSLAESQPLLHRVVWKSIAFLGVLVVFTAIEELVIGWFHHKPAAQVLSEVLERSWFENLAPLLVILLILIPLISLSESYRELGKEQFRRLWLERPTKR